MKTWQKVGSGLAAAAVVGGIVWFSVNQANKGVVTVQTAKVAKQDSLVSLVTASGEIKPTTFTNITAQGFGRITDILVKEGDHIKKGDRLALQDNVQASADVQAQSAAMNALNSGVESAEASYKAAQSDLSVQEANLEKAKLDYDRGQGLFKDGLVPKQDFDQRKTTYDAAVASVEAARARMLMQKAQLGQSQALLIHQKDVLTKTTYFSPINGIVSYLPVRSGEYVVPGIQNATGSFLMTLSDMSTVTSEVKVDETDIVNVKIGQEADVTIDAVPGKVFKGKVTDIGSQAVLRSSGLATTQTTTSNQEAKDFKVVVRLENPPENLRPGLSTTAKIRTAEKKSVVAIPIQALAVRSRKDLDEAAKNAKTQKGGGSSVSLAAPPPPAPGDPKKDEVQGVFVVSGNKAEFRPVDTGISGVTDIEITKGLNPGDEIVVGSYKALRTLKPSAQIKVDNSAPKKTDDQQS